MATLLQDQEEEESFDALLGIKSKKSFGSKSKKFKDLFGMEDALDRIKRTPGNGGNVEAEDDFELFLSGATNKTNGNPRHNRSRSVMVGRGRSRGLRFKPAEPLLKEGEHVGIDASPLGLMGNLPQSTRVIDEEEETKLESEGKLNKKKIINHRGSVSLKISGQKTRSKQELLSSLFD